MRGDILTTCLGRSVLDAKSCPAHLASERQRLVCKFNMRSATTNCVAREWNEELRSCHAREERSYTLGSTTGTGDKPGLHDQGASGTNGGGVFDSGAVELKAARMKKDA